MGREKENAAFRCANCGERVRELTNGGYRNHCPTCLYSKHVDIVPGDRANPCRGLMRPVAIRHARKGLQIVHVCLRCGFTRPNRIAEYTEQPDRIDALIAIMIIPGSDVRGPGPRSDGQRNDPLP